MWRFALCLLLSLHITAGQLEPRYYFSLDGSTSSNYSFFHMENIGEGEFGLHCVTPRRPCCKTPQGVGEWYYPNGTQVPVRAAGHNFFRNRNDDGAVILNRRNNGLSGSGRFKCLIPDINGTFIDMIAGVYSEQAFPTITSHPNSVLNALPGTTVTFTVRARDATRYRWILNGDYYLHNNDRVQGVDSQTLVIRRVEESDEGQYHCSVERLLSRNTETATLTVMDPPLIEQQPVNILNGILEQEISFTMLAVGPELSYKWEFANGNPIPTWIDANYGGIRSSTLTLRRLGARYLDNMYRCVVTNPAGTVHSNSVSASLLTPPEIEVQPESVYDIRPGSEVSLSILASGFDLLYQWQLADGTPIQPGPEFEGVDTPTFTILSLEVEHAQLYRCKVSNLAGTVYSDPANITVVPVPVVSSLNATPGITSIHLSWTPTSSDPSLKFRVSYYHLAFPSQKTSVDIEEPVFVAEGLMPRGRYRFEVQQITTSFEGFAAGVDVRLTENIPAVESIDISVINSTAMKVSWDPIPSLPGWDMTFYNVHSTTLTTHTPSRPLNTHSDRTTNGNESSLVVVHSELLSEESVEMVVEVRGVLDVHVEGVGEIEGEGAVRNITLKQEEVAFQIVLSPTDYCITWSDEKTSTIRNDIQAALARVISRSCECNFTTEAFSPGAFSCRQSSSTVTYRSTITGLKAAEYVSHIEQWIRSGEASLLARSFTLDVSNIPDCPVQITSLTEPDCIPNEQGPTPRTLLTSDPAVINCVNRCMIESGSSRLCSVDP